MQPSLGVMLCAGVIVTMVTTAAAQPVDTPAEQPAPTPEQPESVAAQPEPAPAPDRRDDQAWVLYHSAYSEMARGQHDRARSMLSRLMHDHPDHPAAINAARVMGGAGGTGPGAMPDATPQDDHTASAEQPSASARAELALYQSIHGIALGAELCVLLECDSGEAVLGMVLLGGVGGLTGSLMLTRDGITQGHRALLNSGTSWGAFNAIMMLIVSDADDGQRVATTLLGGQLGGLALGQALWSQTAATEGQVALANTFAIWSGALTLMSLGLMDVNSDDDYAGAMLIMVDLGLLAGAYAAHRHPSISRGRTLLIDAGGIVGALAGGGLSVIIGGNDVDEDLALGSMLVGTAVGLASAAYLSRHWDTRSAPPVRLSLMPHHDGGFMAGVMLDL